MTAETLDADLQIVGVVDLEDGSLTLVPEEDPAAPPEHDAARRRLLASIAGAAAAVGLAAALPRPALGADGGRMLLGTSNTATRATGISTTGGAALSARSEDDDEDAYGIAGIARGTSIAAAGVRGVPGSTSNYGVFSFGKLGVEGPVELANIAVTNVAGPAAGKAFLYTRALSKTTTELRIRFPGGVDRLVASG